MEDKTPSVRWIGFWSMVVALLAPAFVQIYWFPPQIPSLQVWSMFWWLYPNIEWGEWFFELSPFFALGQTMMYIPLRLIFAYQMVRYYQGKSSKKRTFLVGLITELQVFFMNYQNILISILISLPHFLEGRLPIPLMLLAAILVMRFMPSRLRTISWLEAEEKTKVW